MARFAAALYEDPEEQFADTYALKRLGVAADVTKMATFLPCDDASRITRQTVVKGGLTLHAGR